MVDYPQEQEVYLDVTLQLWQHTRDSRSGSELFDIVGSQRAVCTIVWVNQSLMEVFAPVGPNDRSRLMTQETAERSMIVQRKVSSAILHAQ